MKLLLRCWVALHAAVATIACGPGGLGLGEGPVYQVCGDGHIWARTTLDCDDGNAISGDGCSLGCTVEEGWECTGGEYSQCRYLCGDGEVDYDESCDDGNELDGDGCSARCEIEPEWRCPDRQVCFAVPVLPYDAGFDAGLDAGTQRRDDGVDADAGASE